MLFLPDLIIMYVPNNASIPYCSGIGKGGGRRGRKGYCLDFLFCCGFLITFLVLQSGCVFLAYFFS